MEIGDEDNNDEVCVTEDHVTDDHAEGRIEYSEHTAIKKHAASSMHCSVSAEDGCLSKFCDESVLFCFFFFYCAVQSVFC